MPEQLRPVQGSNRHPVDRLGETREQLKALQNDEKALKEEVGLMMGSDDSLGGDEWVADQALSVRKGALDDAKIAAALCVDVEDLDQYRKKATAVVTIRVSRRTGGDE